MTTITFLKCAPKLSLAKHWKQDGSIEPAADAAWFEAEEIPVVNLRDILAILRAAERNPRIALVKEAIAPGANPKRLRRRCESGVDKRSGKAYPAGLRVVERSWIVLDADELPRPDAIDWRDGEALASYVRSQLPDCFKRAACVWQFSGSSGHRSKRDHVRMHLFFMCDDPVLPQAWKSFFARLLFIDESAFDKAHLIFTAAPTIHHGEDPITQRHGLLAGEPVVGVPVCVKARSAQIAQGDNGIKRRTSARAGAPMPEAAAAFVEIISRSNVLRSRHPAYRNERSRRLAFCMLIRANFGVEDKTALELAFHKACVGDNDPNGEHDAEEALEWAESASPSGRSFSLRKLLCDASIALRKEGETEMATRAARLAMVFGKLEQERC
ncbi:hypothetical protein [Methylocystis iwaonis]|uniref:hypothetical protein n=1 Tax=Methylocystis iwaonis TaxID=2885079 RepID=UPI002E7C48AB|nr:hypothetical protein [Methylocystis iwaonis]